MLLTYAPFWKEAPFLRLLVALIPGILIQWYYSISLSAILYFLLFNAIVFFGLGLMRMYRRHQLLPFRSFTLMLIVAGLGMLLTYTNNSRHQSSSLLNQYKNNYTIIASISESPVEKNKSFKALADVFAVYNGTEIIPTTGRVLIYFQKDSSLLQQIPFGQTVLFSKNLQPIANAGNPGAFDYSRYCLFQGITHQVFLNANDFTTAQFDYQNWFTKWLHDCRHFTLNILKKYIHGKNEAALAEALLIGYREDLDRDIVQQYSNTGVIHVIAISGMHLAMIFALLVIVLSPLQKSKYTRWLRGFIILFVLWAFTLLSGAGPSILRSAVMFSFIVVGESFYRQISIYHTLSASAFFLLCANPFFLWDVGFQLSYAAVLSIVIFLKPVTNWIVFHNRILSAIWKTAAVTIAAQILTTPLSIYHFHQLPNLFLLTNLIVVPLSGIILYGEILLCILSGFTPAATLVGDILSYLIKRMNDFIYHVNALPISVTENIKIDYWQTILLYLTILFVSVWLLWKKPAMVKYAVVCLFLIIVIRTVDTIRQHQTARLVVYNVPQHRAVDFFRNGVYSFSGDSLVEKQDFLRNFHLTPARQLFRSTQPNREPFTVLQSNELRILFLEDPEQLPTGQSANVLVLSGRKNWDFQLLIRHFGCRQVVFDSTVPKWKTQDWKNECDSLHLRAHSVLEDGAFVLNL